MLPKHQTQSIIKIVFLFYANNFNGHFASLVQCGGLKKLPRTWVVCFNWCSGTGMYVGTIIIVFFPKMLCEKLPYYFLIGVRYVMNRIFLSVREFIKFDWSSYFLGPGVSDEGKSSKALYTELNFAAFEISYKCIVSVCHIFLVLSFKYYMIKTYIFEIHCRKILFK